MMNFVFIFLVLGLGTPASPNSEVSSGGRFVEVNDVRLYVEIQGEGDPVFIMHGGLHSHKNMKAYTQNLSADYRVIVPDSRGHGSSTGAGGIINYQAMAADMVALLDELGISNAHVIGWSDGGIVGLILAAEHPRLVCSLVTFGANIDPQGLNNDVREFISGWKVEDVNEEVAKAYKDQAAEPELWPTFFNTMRGLWLEAPILETSQLTDIKVPTLLVFGDRDSIRPDHIRLMFDGIAGSQLFIVPGTSHFAPVEKPDLITEVIRSFLKASSPGKLSH